MKKLTMKQQAFVEAYEGNGTRAARTAGYRGSSNTLAQVAVENLRKPHIRQAIQARNHAGSEARIADRRVRQAFWTTVMMDASMPMQVRLRASELLGRSEGDFLNQTALAGSEPQEIVVSFLEPGEYAPTFKS